MMKLKETRDQPLQEIPPAKRFKSKHNLPILDDYNSEAPDHFWDLFPKKFRKLWFFND